jgi:hypothetical protein
VHLLRATKNGVSPLVHISLSPHRSRVKTPRFTANKMSTHHLHPIYILSVAMLVVFSNIYSFSKFLSLFAGYFRTRFTCFSPQKDIPESALLSSCQSQNHHIPCLQTSPSNRHNPHKRNHSST